MSKKIKEKHIERLSRGKASGINIGSRQVPHHLYQHEQTQFSLAIKYGWLTLKPKQRPNLLNLWEKYCVAQNRPLLVLKKYADGSAEVWQNLEVFKFETADQARAYVKNITS